MGWQGHRLSLDEPPPASIYEEAIPRLNFHNGDLRITFTPTPDSPPLEYMQLEVEEGRVAELQTDYSEAACTVRGGPVPWAWKIQPEIDADIASYMPDSREMRAKGSWTPAIRGRRLELIGEHCWVATDFPRKIAYRIGVGIDHGTRPGRQSASLVIEQAGDFWILDEWRPGKATTTREDARGILSMLQRWGIPWQAVDLWIGDRATSASFYGEAKSNKDLLENCRRAADHRERSQGERPQNPDREEAEGQRASRCRHHQQPGQAWPPQGACSGRRLPSLRFRVEGR
jgi:hypothetical protein